MPHTRSQRTAPIVASARSRSHKRAARHRRPDPGCRWRCHSFSHRRIRSPHANRGGTASRSWRSRERRTERRTPRVPHRVTASSSVKTFVWPYASRPNLTRPPPCRATCQHADGAGHAIDLVAAPESPKTRTTCSLSVINLTPCCEGLIISNVFVMGSPRAVKPVKSSARMLASGERSRRRYASFHSLSRLNICASSFARVPMIRSCHFRGRVPRARRRSALACRRQTLAALLGPHRLFRECIHDLPLGFSFVARLEVVLG